MIIQKTNPDIIHSIFARSESIQLDCTTQCFFSEKKRKFIYEGEEHRIVEFDTLEQLACYIAFIGKNFTEAQLKFGRFEWFVLDIEKVLARFPLKQNALLFCVRLVNDKRVPRMWRLEKGLYEYTGPKNNEKHLFVGTRVPLMNNGFGEHLERWDKNALF